MAIMRDGWGKVSEEDGGLRITVMIPVNNLGNPSVMAIQSSAGYNLLEFCKAAGYQISGQVHIQIQQTAYAGRDRMVIRAEVPKGQWWPLRSAPGQMRAWTDADAQRMPLSHWSES